MTITAKLNVIFCTIITVATFWLHPLHAMQAAVTSEDEMVTAILDKWKAKTEGQSYLPKTIYSPWKVTVSIRDLRLELGSEEATKLLLKCFAKARVRLVDIRESDYTNKFTILHYACACLLGNVENVKIILAIATAQNTLESLLDAQDSNGRTAQEIALKEERTESANELFLAKSQLTLVN